MDVAFFICFLFALLARRNAVYHSDMLFNKHINLENKKLKRFFIPKRSKVYKTANANETDRTKMNIVPIILGIIAVVGFVAILVSEILYAKSINQVGFFNTTDAVFKYLFWFLSLLCLSVAVLLINTFKCFGKETTKQKIGLIVRIILIIAFIGGFVCSMFTLFTI